MIELQLYSVNEVIDALDVLHGQTVRVVGKLVIEFEADSIWHLPKSEQRPGYDSSLWARFDEGALGRSPEQLQEFSGRHVLVTGVVDQGFTGHLGLWPGALLVQNIAKVKAGGI